VKHEKQFWGKMAELGRDPNHVGGVMIPFLSWVDYADSHKLCSKDAAISAAYKHPIEFEKWQILYRIGAV